MLLGEQKIINLNLINFQLPSFGNRPSDVEKFLNLSLERLGLDYIDLYLIHMPFSFVQDENSFAPATKPDGSFVLDLQSPLAVWRVNLHKIYFIY